jgi:hypothetical protein
MAWLDDRILARELRLTYDMFFFFSFSQCGICLLEWAAHIKVWCHLFNPASRYPQSMFLYQSQVYSKQLTHKIIEPCAIFRTIDF